METIRISGIVEESIVDGPGIRFVVFTQGCPHKCKECHNPHTHNFDGGKEITVSEIVKKIEKNPLISGVTLSGGEPFCQAEVLCKLSEKLTEMGKHIMIYSGFTYEEILNLPDYHATELLTYADILVDGKFEAEKRDLLLKFRGSANQRIIDVKSSLNSNSLLEMAI